jgi:hypothetical protein
VIATTQKKIMNKKRVADYDFAITTLKKRWITEKTDCIGKKDIY